MYKAKSYLLQIELYNDKKRRFNRVASLLIVLASVICASTASFSECKWTTIISAVIAFFILWAGYAGITHWLTRTDVSWMQIAYVNIVSFSSVARRLILIFLIGGMFIGGAGSMIFVRKYLKV